MTVPWKQVGRRTLKGLGWLIGGALALVVTLYVVLLLVNLRDQPPSEFAQRLEDIYRNRPAVADADNGYIYVMGFAVAPDGDPHEMGLRRLAWLQHRAEHPEDQTSPDPLPDGEYQQPQSPAYKKIREACGWGKTNCDSALAESDATLPEWIAAEQWRVDRYRTLLARPGWLETLPPDLMAPLPAYQPVLDAQRMLLAQAHHLAGQGDAAGVREILEQDVRFWRAILRDSDILISKMMAVAALSRHFNMGNLALRRLPPELQLTGMPEQWRAALTQEELSWHRCFAGEWIYSRNILRQLVTEQAMPATVALGEEYVSNSLEDLATRPLFQLQDTNNQSAEMLVRAADALQVPIERFTDGRDVAATIFESPAARMFTLANLYNPIGDILSGIAGGGYDSYPPRVADVEGVRRAAVLATELRSRKVDVANVRAEIDASGIRMPYTGVAFVWDSKTQAIQFIGLVPGERGLHSFKY